MKTDTRFGVSRKLSFKRQTSCFLICVGKIVLPILDFSRNIFDNVCFIFFLVRTRLCFRRESLSKIYQASSWFGKIPSALPRVPLTKGRGGGFLLETARIEPFYYGERESRAAPYLNVSEHGTTSSRSPTFNQTTTQQAWGTLKRPRGNVYHRCEFSITFASKFSMSFFKLKTFRF